MNKPQRMAECHPDRPYYAKGLCQKCYKRKQHEDDRERHLALMKEWRKENPELKREGTRKWQENNRDHCYEKNLLRRYGLTLIEYDKLLEAQDDTCAICGKTSEENGKRLGVDHNHTTGAVRGLLCTCCNSMLGFAQDNIAILARAISYIEEDKGDPPPPQ